MHGRATCGSMRLGQGAEGEASGKHMREPVPWFPQEERGEAGEVDLGLVTLNDFSGLRSIDAVPSCLVPRPGGLKQRSCECPGV